MGKVLTLCLVVVGLINFIPVVGVLSAAQLENAYQITLLSADMEVLMRHRALLFGLLGGLVLFSAFKAVYQNVAMVMAGISMVGFALLVLSVEAVNPAVFKVLLVDVVGIFFLTVAIIIKCVFKTD